MLREEGARQGGQKTSRLTRPFYHTRRHRERVSADEKKLRMNLLGNVPLLSALAKQELDQGECY